MRAMRAREVTPEEAPELHGMIDRLCALADMPKPRVGIADMAVPNAFATGRSPDRAVVCVTTGILRTLDAEELEAVLAHELSHVAHRDVLVMTVASSAGIAAGLLMRAAQFGGMGRSRNNNSALPAVLVALVVSLVVYAVSFLLLRLLSRYRELSADRAGAYLTLKPAALGSALQKISGEAAATPTRDLRAGSAASALCIVPALRGGGLSGLHGHPPAPAAAARAAGPHPGRAQPADGLRGSGMGLWETMRARTQPKRNNLDALFLVPSAAITLQTALGFEPTGSGSVCYRSAAGAAFAQTQDDVVALIRDDAEAPRGDASRRTTSASPGSSSRVTRGDMAGLCTDLHAVNTTLELNGFESGLLCSMVPFANAAGQRFGLTYLYKQGTFYPFAPSGEQSRDTLLELSVRDLLDRGAADGARPAALAGACGRLRACERRPGAATSSASGCWRRTTSSAGRRAASSTRWSSSPPRWRACPSPRSTSSAPTPSTRSPRPGSRVRTRRSRTRCAGWSWSPGEPIMLEDAGQDARFADNPWTTGEIAPREVLRLAPAAHAGGRGHRHAVRVRQRHPPGDPARRPRGWPSSPTGWSTCWSWSSPRAGSARPTRASARPTTAWPTSPARSATTSRTR